MKHTTMVGKNFQFDIATLAENVFKMFSFSNMTNDLIINHQESMQLFLTFNERI